MEPSRPQWVPERLTPKVIPPKKAEPEGDRKKEEEKPDTPADDGTGAEEKRDPTSSPKPKKGKNPDRGGKLDLSV